MQICKEAEVTDVSVYLLTFFTYRHHFIIVISILCHFGVLLCMLLILDIWLVFLRFLHFFSPLKAFFLHLNEGLKNRRRCTA